MLSENYENLKKINDQILSTDRELVIQKDLLFKLKEELTSIELKLYTESFDIILENGKPKYSNEKLREGYIIDVKNENTRKFYIESLKKECSLKELNDIILDTKMKIDINSCNTDYMKRLYEITINKEN